MLCWGARERSFYAKEVSRSGEMPGPTVIVRKEEDRVRPFFSRKRKALPYGPRIDLPIPDSGTNLSMRRITMNEMLLSSFGDPAQRVEKAFAAVRRGSGVLVTDDEGRENEGDMIFPAESLRESQMAMLIREGSGIVCLCLTEEKVAALNLPMMVKANTSRFQTAFTVSIEAAVGVTTGVSARDRLTTVRAAVAEEARPEHLHRPGHIFPLRARSGGVLERQGHTEATVDLMRLAGLRPCGVLCELTNADGTMSLLPEIVGFARKNDMPVLTVEDLIEYRRAHS
jgi:3,4-dihydroxy 2-butanone 4-phosphate synthase